MTADAVLERLGANGTLGLTSDETASRLALFGPNELEPDRKTSLLRLVWDGAREPFVILLFIAGCLAIALDEVRDGLLVLVILAPIVGAGVVTEYRGEKALEALREAAAPIGARQAGRLGRGRADPRPRSGRPRAAADGRRGSGRPAPDPSRGPQFRSKRADG